MAMLTKILDELIRIWQELTKYFQGEADKDWVSAVLTVLTLVVSYFSGLIGLIVRVVKAIFNKKSLEQYRILEANAKTNEKQFKNEPFFFDEGHERKYFFCKLNGKLFENYFTEKTVRFKKFSKKSYVIIGEAGCGKSAWMKYDYLSARKKRWKHGTVYQWYLDSKKLIELLNDPQKLETVHNNIKIAKYNKTILYLDGIDEIGASMASKLLNFIEDSRSKIACDLIVKITCRPDFFKNYLDRKLELISSVNVLKLPEDQLHDLGIKIIKHLKRRKYASINKPKAELKCFRKLNLKEYSLISTPLSLKMYLYCRLHGNKHLNPSNDNRYNLYECFVNSIVKNYCRRENRPQNDAEIKSQLTLLSGTVFNSLKRKDKELTLQESTCIKPLTKDNGSFITMIHETFYEFFVAKYYLNALQIDLPTNLPTQIDVLSLNYSNDYADFITAAIESCTEQKRDNIAKRLCALYYSTFDSNTKNTFNSRFRNHGYQNYDISAANNNIHPCAFFSLKYEIIFRFGRLSMTSTVKGKIIKFIEFVYENDKSTGLANVSTDENSNTIISDQDYYVSVLKRCCAISASFLGAEKIEIDYVEHMLPPQSLFPDYNSNHDLANRSHTLLFYGDITNQSIFCFQDTDPSQSCDKAMRKRLSRLAKLDSEEDVTRMNKKSKKSFISDFLILQLYIHSFIAEKTVRG